ncbi:MAG: MaoC family dehydratase N-terminal domain-containing protein [Polyangiaceae bacterium]|nr:MaoC family dehydratase N-terminal domain-containing protein [Polyangiaceae bacterium]
MALRLSAVGESTGAHIHEYEARDVMLYALGVGAKAERELDFLYEGRGPKVLPTYAVVPAWPAMEEVFDLIGGDLLGVVHGGQTIRLHRPFAPEGRLVTVARVDGLYDLKRMATGFVTTETRDADGTLIAETTWHIIFRNDGGFDGPRPPKRPRITVPADAAPVFEWVEATSPEQALLYRLSGDRNPLHADPAIGEKAGFGKPILHGLCTFGYAGRAALHSLADGDPSRLVAMEASFQAPVWPGETLVIRGYSLDAGKFALVATTKERPEEVVVGNAFVEIA